MPRISLGHTLITGGSGAIGAALIRTLSERDPNIAFSMLDIDTDSTSRVANRVDTKHHVINVDLSRPDDLPKAVADAVEHHGPVDTLINCAGIMDIRTFGATDWESGLKLLNIDLISPLRLMSLTVPRMIENGSGNIVNISSMAGRVPIRGCAYYGAAKAGLAMASEISRLELKQNGVNVLTVYPGPIYSYLERSARAQVPDSMLNKLLPTGKPEDIAKVIVQAMIDRQAQVAYPPPYAIANKIVGIASAVTARFSPQPLR